MKKWAIVLLSVILTFSSFSVGIPNSESTFVAQAKTTKQLEKDGFKKVKTYLYSQTSNYKKVRLIYYFSKSKNGDLKYEVYEDMEFRYNYVGNFKLTKKSKYKKLYVANVNRTKYKHVKTFKK